MVGTDSKSKWVQKTQYDDHGVREYNTVVFTYYFRILICDAVSQFNDGAYKENVSLTQGCKKIMHSPSTKIAAANNVTRSCVKCHNHWEKRETSQTNYRYQASTSHNSPSFQVFCCNIEIAENIKQLFASVCVSNIIYGVSINEKQPILLFKATKIKKSNDVVKDHFRWQWPPIFAHFSSSNFLAISS